jgi:hypothetical protein
MQNPKIIYSKNFKHYLDSSVGPSKLNVLNVSVFTYVVSSLSFQGC